MLRLFRDRFPDPLRILGKRVAGYGHGHGNGHGGTQREVLLREEWLELEVYLSALAWAQRISGDSHRTVRRWAS